MTKRSKRTLLTLSLAGLLFVGSIIPGNWQTDPLSVAAETNTETEPETGTATGVNVAYHTQEEIRAYVEKNGAKLNDALTFSKEPGIETPYSLGKLSEETRKSAIAMLNQIRYIAGISDQVESDDEYEELAQAASLCNYVNKKMTHYPEQPSDMEDDMYALAYKGASSSNIAWASWANRSLNETIVKSWMNDGDANNIPMVGLRRWFLNPTMGKTGFGAVSGSNGTYSAVYTFDKSNSSAKEYGVMWPAQNMPLEYFDKSYPWSISMGYKVESSDVQVTLIRKSDGKSWEFSETNKAAGSFYVNNEGYGQVGCIIFRPETDFTGYQDGDIYEVTITGLSENVSYTVQFFNLTEAKEEPTPSPTVKPTPSPTVEPTPSPSATPTPSPSMTPTSSPSTTPTPSPSVTPTPSSTPIPSPTKSPDAQPTRTPDIQPTQNPGVQPSQNPSEQPQSSSSAASSEKVKKPSKVKLLSLKSTGKKKLKVKWKWKSDQDGYQIQYATNRKFTKNKKSIRLSAKKSNKTIKGLKSKKTYFVRVRALRASSGKQYPGAWSKIKKCKVK